MTTLHLTPVLEHKKRLNIRVFPSCLIPHTARIWHRVIFVSSLSSRNIYGSDEEVKSAVRKFFREQNSVFYKNGFKKLVYRWHKCIEVEGDYVEK
jgi:hypothetical protein